MRIAGWPALWIVGAVLLLSGFYAAALIAPLMTDHLLLGIKLLLSLAFLGRRWLPFARSDVPGD